MSARAARRSSPRGRPGPWWARTRRSGAKRAASRCQVPTIDMGQTAASGRAASPAPVDGLEREQLDGLAQAHVVGQAGAQPERGEERQPGDAALLVGPQLRGERRRAARPGSACGPRCRRAGRRASRPRRCRSAAAAGRRPVAARGEREHVGGRRRPAVAAAEELEAAAQRGLVHAHPGPAQPHQRGLRGDEGGDLLLVEGGSRRRRRPATSGRRRPARGPARRARRRPARACCGRTAAARPGAAPSQPAGSCTPNPASTSSAAPATSTWWAPSGLRSSPSGRAVWSAAASGG